MKYHTSANELSLVFFDHPWTPEIRSVTESPAGRLIKSIILLEGAGYDWKSAVKSERFSVGRETVARILAYPQPGVDCEISKLLQDLKVPGKNHGQYLLTCDVYPVGIPEFESERELWQKADQIATSAYHAV